MIRVGLTGNIGSGKSTVAKIFEILGTPVFYADDIAKGFLSDANIIAEIIESFGEKILTPDQKIDRKKLADIVFRKQEALDILNGIIHPRVREAYSEWLDQHQKDAYTLHEAAIMFESGFYKMLDKIIFVSAPKSIRIERIIKRDQVTQMEVEQRMRNQWPEEDKISKSDFVIINDDEHLIIPQIIKINRQLQSLSISNQTDNSD